MKNDSYDLIQKSIFFSLQVLLLFLVCRLTFRLFTTFQSAHKALRSSAAGWNVDEGAV
jgi:hypothetical protein